MTTQRLYEIAKRYAIKDLELAELADEIAKGLVCLVDSSNISALLTYVVPTSTETARYKAVIGWTYICRGGLKEAREKAPFELIQALREADDEKE